VTFGVDGGVGKDGVTVGINVSDFLSFRQDFVAEFQE